ncbi:uncharacterized protein C2845_PM16G08120 [Panicum miliaceum]|uniref:Uncharacterized protein n=1 Tax=Panicum miliaceum TaxID=4540 RepID=A0A3L6PWV7_PANMI|nr:uncharacterized protein C2845_PM16G08120 [Panicum miliaceum]
MEGLQMQSTSESLQINLLRLRAVQSQFQQLLLQGSQQPAATSMLTLRQVLMAEKPKVTPAELGNSISELFEALLKILDGSPDAGAEEIVEAMIGASASEADDRHCAFRGVVLGGSGPRGRKLADAALRRVSAAKLVGRVVKAAEVVIRVATVSEKVHGPWYAALMRM